MSTTKHTSGLSADHINKLAEPFGAFEFGDAQGDKTRAFAQVVIDAHERVRQAAPDLMAALQGLLADIEGLIDESEGVAGLHLNGDVADWGSLVEGGRFERLSNLSAARAAIAKATRSAA